MLWIDDFAFQNKCIAVAHPFPFVLQKNVLVWTSISYLTKTLIKLHVIVIVHLLHEAPSLNNSLIV